MEKPCVVHEDDSLLVLDKPAGWIVNEANTAKSPVVQKWLRDNFNYTLSGSRFYRSGIVHRLDKETSGVLLVAKEKSVFLYLQKLFKERLVEKHYIALVHGEVEDDRGEVEAPVGRLPWNRERFGVLPRGRPAATSFNVLKILKDQKGDMYSLLEFQPKTGRTHQIRIHAKYLNHPIVSDTFYAGRKVARKDRLWCLRLFLHAEKIIFNHPESLKKVCYKTGLPVDLKSALKSLSEVPIRRESD